MNIPQHLIENWSLSGDRQYMNEMEPYIIDCFNTGDIDIVECWRGDTTNSPVTNIELTENWGYEECVSWSTKEYAANMFADCAVEEYGGEGIIYHVLSCHVVDIAGQSNLRTEREVITSPDTKFEITDAYYDDEKEKWLVELVEISW